MEVRTDRHSYPALRIASLMTFGVVLADSAPSPLSSSLQVFFLVLIAGLLLLILCRRDMPHYGSLLAGLLCILAGAAKLTSDRAVVPRIPGNIINREITIAGVIEDWPRKEYRRTSFLIRTEAIVADSHRFSLPLLMNVTVLRTRSDSLIPSVRHGTRILLRGTFTLPRKTRNPGEISEALFCEVNGVSGFLFTRGHRYLKVLGEGSGSFDLRQLVTPARTFILLEIDRRIGGEEGEFLKGLLIGERGGIPAATREAFAVAGVAHILAVSGSNVAVIAAFLLAALNLLRMPAGVRSVIVACGLVAYMVITGSQPPVIRATIMALTFLLGHLLERRTNAFNTLGLSALIMLFLDSRQVFDIGFQLSFGAVFSILYFYPRLVGAVRNLHRDGLFGTATRATWALASVTLAATLGTLPFTAVYFGRVSLVGFLTNLLVVPLSGGCVILGCVACIAEFASSWLAEAYASLNWVLLRVLLVVTKVSGGLPHAAMEMYGFRMVHSLPYYAVLFCVFSWHQPVSFRFHLIAFLVSVNFVVFATSGISADTQESVRVTILDVGQGDAIACDLPGGKHLLIDAGPCTPSFDAGRRVLVPYFRRRGIDTLDLLVLTHGHADHTGGLASICAGLSLREVMVPSARARLRLDSLYSRIPGISRPVATEGVCGAMLQTFPGVRVYVLSPEESTVATDSLAGGEDGNNASIVLKLEFGKTSFLFCGDAEAPVEECMVKRFGSFLQSGILKVAHHGSTTGTTQEFLSVVAPQIAVISVGRNNSFGHPSSKVIARLQQFGCMVHRTDEGGALVVESDGQQLSCIDWR